MLTHHNYTNIAYEPTQGHFYRTRETSLCNAEIIRRLLPDEDGNIFAIDPQGKQLKRKAHNLAWIIAKGEIPEGYVVLQVQDDLKLSSLRLITKEEYFQYKDAEYNLFNGVKIIEDTMKCTYSVRYRKDNKVQTAKGYSYAEALKIKDYVLSTAKDVVDDLSKVL